MNNEPLKDLLRIASRDMFLAVKIADKFPLELIDYEVIIREQSFFDTGKTTVSHLLIDKLDPETFSLKNLLKIRRNVEYTKKSFVESVIIRIPDYVLDPAVIFATLKSSDEEGSFLSEKLSERLPKSIVNLKSLTNMSRSKNYSVSRVAKRLILKHFSKEIGFDTLMKLSNDSDDNVRDESIRILLTDYSGRLNYANFITFLTSKDQGLRTWARNLAVFTSVEQLDYIELLYLCDKTSDKEGVEQREVISILLKKILPHDFDVVSLFNMMENTRHVTAQHIREIIFRIAKSQTSILFFTDALPFVRSEHSDVRLLSREILVSFFSKHDSLSYELLLSFYDEASQEIKQKIAEIMLDRYPEKIGMSLLIPFLGLQLSSISERAKKLINAFSPDQIDVFEIIEFASFSKTTYDLTPIHSFVSSYLESLPNEIILNQESKLTWYITNEKDRTVKETIEKLLKFCRTDYEASMNDFFEKHNLKVAM